MTPVQPPSDVENASETATPPTNEMPPLGMCTRCGARWRLRSIAHCAACHRTFGSVDLFDRHRLQRGEHGMCEDPELLPRRRGQVARMRLVDGVWREAPKTGGWPA